jgi:hypothetical protein
MITPENETSTNITFIKLILSCKKNNPNIYTKIDEVLLNTVDDDTDVLVKPKL